ncbi:MAG: ATP/GTP-binding protein [Anaerolineae bacterium]|nr:ATP/GTP-binding protein [Anaerolineae bacterium]
MGKAFKIIVAGPFNAGKSEFIRTASDIPVVSTDRKITDELAVVKETTTVAMDYGHVTVAGDLFHLYGTPGQERFNFMWDILAREMDGLLVLVDSSDRFSLTVARRILRHFRRRSQAPMLVVATKQDKTGVMLPAEIAERLNIRPLVMVVPCDPRQKSSTRQVLQQLSVVL